MKIYFDNSGCAVHRYGYTDGRCTCRLGGEDALVINESIFAGAGLQGFLEAEKILSEAEKAAITKVWGRHANDAGEEYLFTDLACACRKGSIDPDAATAYLSGIFNGWDREVTFPPIYLAGGLDQVACVQKRPGIYANCQTDIGLAILVSKDQIGGMLIPPGAKMAAAREWLLRYPNGPYHPKGWAQGVTEQARALIEPAAE